MSLIPDRDREYLKARFDSELVNPVTITAFTRRSSEGDETGLECEYCAETEDLVLELAELSRKLMVDVREYSSDDETVKRLGIDKLPAMVIGADGGGSVRYYGIPGGFEFSSLVEDVIDVSRGATGLSAESRERVKGVEKDIHIQVFVTPTCPYCPSAVRIAHQMAIENPEHIRADAVEAAEFPHLVSKYDINAVPTIVINEDFQVEGALPEADFADHVVRVAA